MGIILRKNETSSCSGITRLLIDCSDKPPLKVYSINRPLSEALLKLRPRMRSLQMEKCFLQIIQALPDNAYIRDIDAMFNPSYSIDIITTLISVYKQKPFSLVWPGTLRNDCLIYSEEGYADYKTYEINDYDIVVLK